MKKICFLVVLIIAICSQSAFGIDYYPRASCANHGATGTGCAKTLVDAIGASNGTLIFRHSSASPTTNYAIGTSLTVPANIKVVIEPGAVLSVPGNLVVNGTYESGTEYHLGTVRLKGSSSGYVGLQGAASAGSTTYTLPAADGTSGQGLVTNGSGVLSWSSSAGSVTSFDTITTGSNTIAAMDVSSGASLSPSGTGTVTANRLLPLTSEGDGLSAYYPWWSIPADLAATHLAIGVGTPSVPVTDRHEAVVIEKHNSSDSGTVTPTPYNSHIENYDRAAAFSNTKHAGTASVLGLGSFAGSYGGTVPVGDTSVSILAMSAVAFGYNTTPGVDSLYGGQFVVKDLAGTAVNLIGFEANIYPYADAGHMTSMASGASTSMYLTGENSPTFAMAVGPQWHTGLFIGTDSIMPEAVNVNEGILLLGSALSGNAYGGIRMNSGYLTYGIDMSGVTTTGGNIRFSDTTVQDTAFTLTPVLTSMKIYNVSTPAVVVGKDLGTGSGGGIQLGSGAGAPSLLITRTSTDNISVTHGATAFTFQVGGDAANVGKLVADGLYVIGDAGAPSSGIGISNVTAVSGGLNWVKIYNGATSYAIPYVSWNSGSPSFPVPAGGSTTHVQYNNAGALAGSSNFTWNNASSILTITGSITSTSDITINNNVALKGKDSGGTARTMVKIGATNTVTLDNSSGGGVDIAPSATAVTNPVYIRVNGVSSQQVTVDDAGTCGANWRCLRVPN